MSDWITDRIKHGPGLVVKNGVIDVNHFDPRFADPSLATPVAHAYTHADGGSDEVTLAQSQVTGLSAALGDKVDDDDARLSDARTPTAHAASHEDGGSDELELAQSQITGLGASLAGKSDTGHTHVGLYPAPSMPADARKVLGVFDDGSVGWVAVSGASFPFIFDSAELFDSASTFDEEWLP